MKFTFWAIFFSFCLSMPLGMIGQTNLISNGSFENFSDLPMNLGEWQKCNGWSNAGSDDSDPDFYHYDGGMAADLPETPVANIQSHSGMALMGFVAAKESDADYREYITNELSEPLETGEKYELSFYLSNGEITSNSNCGLGVSGLGIAFTKESPIQNQNSLLPLNPQFTLDTVVFNHDWVKFKCIITATEEFKYLTIGVFSPDSEIEIEQESGSNANVAYYFMDDFHLEVYDPQANFGVDFHVGRAGDGNSESNPEPENQYYADETEFYIPNAFTPDEDGINDVFKPYSPNLANYTFQIFDRWGDEIFSTENIALGWDGMSKKGTRAECGVYIWRVTYLDEAEDGEKITRSLSGRINLIR